MGGSCLGGIGWERNPKLYYEARRDKLAERLTRVVSDARILDAFRSVPRELFVPEEMRRHAYEDRALPLAQGQTISQPSMIAIMFEALAPSEGNRALEIGGGSGYAAAVLSRFVREVHTVELLPDLAAMARDSLRRAGIENVTVHVGDGSRGLPAHAPYDRILVSAGAHRVPDELVSELAPGGLIVIPVDDVDAQVLRIGRRQGGAHEVQWTESVPCVFVPLVQTAP